MSKLLLNAVAGSRFDAIVVGCVLLLGCGSGGQNRDVHLGVPYRAQAPGSMDCGPASVLMWRLYDGLPEVSQTSINQWMGGSSCGFNEPTIAAAVNYFTYTHDAYADYEGLEFAEDFFSRQITSIDNSTPVIPVINSFHAGVINGGKWKKLTNGKYEWDYVYVHDPLTFANDYYVAGDWLYTNCPLGSDTCAQVVSSGATFGWQGNYSTYGTRTRVYGYYCPDLGELPNC